MSLAPLIVATTLSVGEVILLESVLSFLGLGIQPPLASWGTMLSNAQQMIATAPLLAIYPGLMIFLTVIACNLLGDALQRLRPPGRATHLTAKIGDGRRGAVYARRRSPPPARR